MTFNKQKMPEMDLVRYETRGWNKEYWIKDRRVLRVLDQIEQWVERVWHKRV